MTLTAGKVVPPVPVPDTVTKALPLPVPLFPVPVQVTVNILLAVNAPVENVPDVPVPLPVPALQDVVFVDVQLIVDEPPEVTDVGFAVTLTAGKVVPFCPPLLQSG